MVTSSFAPRRPPTTPSPTTASAAQLLAGIADSSASGSLKINNNLSDVASVTTSRDNLGMFFNAESLWGNPTTASATATYVTVGTGLAFSGGALICTVTSGSAGGANLWAYRAKTSTTSGDPGNGYILWNNATQTSASQINFSDLTNDDADVSLFLQTITTSDTIYLQDRDNAANFQKWTAGAITVTTGYVQIPVTYVTSSGTGTTGFSNNHQIVAARFSNAVAGGGTVTRIDTGTGLTGGPITAAGTVSITTSGVTTGLIAASAVTYPKIQSVTASALLGNPTTASAAVSEIALGTGLAFSGSQLISTVTSGASTAYHPGFASNRYYTAVGTGNWGNTGISTNRLYAIPFYCPFTQTFTRLSVVVITGVGASSLELGVYTNSGGLPNQLLVDGGSTSSAGTGNIEISGLTINLTPAWYWLVFASDGALTVQGYTNASWVTGEQLGYSSPGTFATGVYGAWTFSAGNLPASFPAVTYNNGGAQGLVYIRV